MSWLFSRALVEEFSGENSSDGEPSALLKSNPTPGAYCAKDKTTDYSRLSRYGMTLQPLTESPGEDLSMSCLADFLVKISHAREKGKESAELAPVSGEKWHELSARYDLDSHGWKTHLCLWVEDLDWSSVTFPKWGMTLAGVLCQRRTPGRLTSVKESGYLPTPAASEPGYQTANHPPVDKNGDPVKGPDQRWYDPDTGRLVQKGLTQLVQMWPTPRSCSAMAAKINPNAKFPNLETEVAKTGATGQLNPTWVEWLMGWPLGWTDLKPLGTDKCRKQWPWPGGCSAVLSEVR